MLIDRVESRNLRNAKGLCPVQPRLRSSQETLTLIRNLTTSVTVLITAERRLEVLLQETTERKSCAKSAREHDWKQQISGKVVRSGGG